MKRYSIETCIIIHNRPYTTQSSMWQRISGTGGPSGPDYISAGAWRTLLPGVSCVLRLWDKAAIRHRLLIAQRTRFPRATFTCGYRLFCTFVLSLYCFVLYRFLSFFYCQLHRLITYSKSIVFSKTNFLLLNQLILLALSLKILCSTQREKHMCKAKKSYA